MELCCEVKECESHSFFPISIGFLLGNKWVNGMQDIIFLCIHGRTAARRDFFCPSFRSMNMVRGHSTKWGAQK